MGYDLLTALCGIVIGFALGLTGGGGSIFAVPLLIYALGVDVRTAVGVSLAAVGATAALGVLARLHSNDIDYRIGLTFAVSGMLAAGAGTWIGKQLPPSLVLLVFAVLMLVVAVRMWRNSGGHAEGRAAREATAGSAGTGGWLMLIGVGLFVGLLTGIFGVGGGFIIVPALVLFGGVPIQRAVVTSLLVITLVCMSGVASYLMSGEKIPVALTAIFVAGGGVGMLAGGQLRKRLSGPNLRRTFAVAMSVVAIFVIFESLWRTDSVAATRRISEPDSPQLLAAGPTIQPL